MYYVVSIVNKTRTSSRCDLIGLRCFNPCLAGRSGINEASKMTAITTVIETKQTRLDFKNSKRILDPTSKFKSIQVFKSLSL